MSNPVDKELQEKQEKLDGINKDIELGEGTLNANAAAANRAQGEFEDWEKKRIAAENAANAALKAKEDSEKATQALADQMKIDQEKLSGIKSEITTAETALVDLNKQEKTLTESIAKQTLAVGNKIKADTAELEKERASLESIVENKKVEEERLDTSIANKKSEEGRLSNVLYKKNQELSEIEKKSVKAEAKIEALNNKFKNVSTNLDDAARRLLEIEQDKKGHYAEIASLTKDIQDMNTIKAEIQAEINVLKSEQEALQLEKEEVRRDKVAIVRRREELFNKEQDLKDKYKDVGMEF